MWNTESFLQAGSTAQRAAISGIASGHAFEKHGQDIPDASKREYAASAMKDLNSADQAYVLDQHGGQNILFGNSNSGMVGYVNTSDPSLSTYFRPEGKTVEEYIQDKVQDASSFGVKELSDKDYEQINRAPSVDHASNYHEAPQFNELSKEVGLEMSTPGSQTGPDATREHDEPSAKQ